MHADEACIAQAVEARASGYILKDSALPVCHTAVAAAPQAAAATSRAPQIKPEMLLNLLAPRVHHVSRVRVLRPLHNRRAHLIND